MKSKRLLLTLLMALLVPWVAQAQETLTVYDETTGTLTSNSYVPMYGNYFDDYTKSEFVIPANKLSNMDGGTITSLKFYIQSVGTYGSGWSSNQQVFLKEVSSTSLSAFSGTDDATIVWEGSFTVPSSSDTEFEITFTTPYEYQGGNLLVGIYNITEGGYRSVAWYGQTVTGASGSGSSSSLSGVSFSQKNFIPKTTFTYTPVSTTCPNPKTLVASNVTAHGATMTWTMDDETSEYQFNLEYKKTTEETWTRIGLGNTRSYPLTGLVAETEYQVRIQTACEPENTYWKNLNPNIITEVACPAPTNLDVTDGSITAHEATVTWTGTSESYVVMIGQENLAIRADFEDQAIPADFTSTTDYPFTVVENTHSGAYCAKSGNGDVDVSTSDMVLEVTLSADMTLTFSAKVSSESGWDKAYFSIDGVDKINAISGDGNWIDYSYPLTAGTHTLRWYYEKDDSNASYDDCFYVDDIVITAGVASWTEYTTTNQTYPFNNLTPNRSYLVKVKGNCGDEGYSQETTPVSFTTLPSCFAPTGLAMVAGYPTAHGASFTWDYQTGEVFQFALVQGNVTDPAEVNFNTDWYAGDNFPMWNTLSADTDWSFFLRKNCDGDFSDPVYVNFHTLEACPAPTGFAVAENGIGSHTATLEWEGTSNSYQVSYRTKAYMDGIEEGFGTGLPSGWENKTGLLSNIMNGAAMSTTTQWVFGSNNGVFDNHARINIYGDSRYGWLITPEMTLPQGATFSFDLALTAFSGTGAASGTCDDDRFVVLVYADNAWHILREWNNADGSQYVYNNIPTAGMTVNDIDISAYIGKTVKFAFYGESTTSSNGDNNMHIDNVSIGKPVAAGEMQYATNIEAETVTLPGLFAETLYEAWLLGDCGDEGFSTEVGPITFTTDVACPAPTGFTRGETMATYAILNWAVGASAWQLQVNNNNPIDIDIEDVIVNEGVVTYTLNGLTENTQYTLKLRANCGSEGFSTWTTLPTFTTPVACPVPANVNITNTEHHSATVNWDVESSDGFTVKYRTAASWNLDGINEGFEDGTMPIGWTQSGPGTWAVTEGYGYNNIAAHGGTYSIRCGYKEREAETFLITPMLDLSGQTDATMNFWFINYNWGTTDIDQLYVYYRVNEGAWTELWNTTEDHQTWTNSGDITLPNPSANYQIGFKKIDKYGHGLALDDIVIGTPTQNPAGEWNEVSAEVSPANIGNLAIETKYEVVVVPGCDETIESEPVFFTTRSANDKVFATAGDWGTASNWIPAGAPTFDQTAELRANATITGEAFAKTINQGNYTITIENGGKLKSQTGVTATVKKTIRGYNTNYDATTYNNGDYYLITNPLTSSISSTSTPNITSIGMLEGNYDLYSWDYTQAEEWRNFEAEGSTFTSLNSGAYGYLYANEEGTTLTYTGTLNAYTGNKGRSTSASTYGTYDFNGWHLLGNPYMYDAYVANASSNGTAVPYVKMNADGDDFENVAAGTPIAPMEGFFCQSENATYTYVVTYVPTVPSDGMLNMNLRKGNKQLDNAILVFGGDQQLGKMTFRANSSKIYMPVEGKDYAITTAESNMGEMPVSFKAENNGTYTLNFNAEEVTFAYLHLIDNMTGVETDLLETPSYTFEAKTTDYASRFRLVFATGNNGSDDNFAFFSNGSFVINNEGNATLQVIDVTGRIIKSENINGCANVNVNAAPGVYMLRLINGDNVKVQKIVVR